VVVVLVVIAAVVVVVVAIYNIRTFATPYLIWLNCSTDSWKVFRTPLLRHIYVCMCTCVYMCVYVCVYMCVY
jgi:hypothetical protein